MELCIDFSMFYEVQGKGFWILFMEFKNTVSAFPFFETLQKFWYFHTTVFLNMKWLFLKRCNGTNSSLGHRRFIWKSQMQKKGCFLTWEVHFGVYCNWDKLVVGCCPQPKHWQCYQVLMLRSNKFFPLRFFRKKCKRISFYPAHQFDSRVNFKPEATINCEEDSDICIAHLLCGFHFSQALRRALRAFASPFFCKFCETHEKCLTLTPETQCSRLTSETLFCWINPKESWLHFGWQVSQKFFRTLGFVPRNNVISWHILLINWATLRIHFPWALRLSAVKFNE